MSKKLEPIETFAEDLNKVASRKGPKGDVSGKMVDSDCTLPMQLSFVVADEPTTLMDELGK